LEPVLLIATDGELDDFATAFAALQRFPGGTYILALGGELPTEWTAASVADGVVVLTDRVVLGDVARAVALLIEAASDRREDH
jgi:hypothetical protein